MFTIVHVYVWYLVSCETRFTSLPFFQFMEWISIEENQTLKDKHSLTERLRPSFTCVHTWPTSLLPMPCYHPQSSYWLFSPSPGAQWHKGSSNTQWKNPQGKDEVSYYRKCKPSTLMKLSVSFRQVWHGAAWTTESSDRSNRAGSDDQDHHMILEWKCS